MYRIKQNSANNRTYSAFIKTINSHLYHYANNNPVIYTDPNGTDATNRQKYHIAGKLEKSMGTDDSCDIKVNIPRFNPDGSQIFNSDGSPSYIKNIDTLIIAPGETAYGSFDWVMDYKGNYYKVTAKIGTVDFIVMDEYLAIDSLDSLMLNETGDLVKKIGNKFLGSNLILSGVKLKDSAEAIELEGLWGQTIKEEAGLPSQWMLNYNTLVDQYSLRKYLNENERIKRQIEELNKILSEGLYW